MTDQQEKFPVALKQHWVVRMPNGVLYTAGSSYHLTEAHRADYVKEIASCMTGPGEERQEPLGEPLPTHVREALYEKIVAQGGSFRVR